MGQVSRFLREGKTGFLHWCPACEEMHLFTTKNKQANGATWRFDGNVDCPTFTPSMRIRWGRQADPKCAVGGGCCHYILTKGVINFCGDCTHAFKGKAVQLPDLPERYRDGPACVWNDG